MNSVSIDQFPFSIEISTNLVIALTLVIKLEKNIRIKYQKNYILFKD